MENVEEVGFPDLVLPGVDGKDVQLSAVDAPVILVHFWTASDASQNIYNTQVLKPLYDKYKGKGLEIYAVSYDTDKALWAQVVSKQNAGWGVQIKVVHYLLPLLGQYEGRERSA